MSNLAVKYFYIFVIVLCAIVCIYILGSCFVIDEKIKYGNGFKVVIQEKLFPSVLRFSPRLDNILLKDWCKSL